MKGKTEREQVKTKMQYTGVQFSVHCLHFRGKKVSMQLHAKQFKDGTEVISVDSFLTASPTPRVGYCNL